MKTKMISVQKPVLLSILDGWGLAKKSETNAVSLAKTPNLDAILAISPMTSLTTNGLNVGLPEGVMGNSEVGHQNMGAGRVVKQSLVRMNEGIETGEFFTNPEINNAFQNSIDHGSAVHIMGLLSDGGVHSDERHLYSLLEKAKQMKVQNVFIHAFMDGRDTPPTSGKAYIQKLVDKIREIGVGKIATVSGRYFAMDRDNNFDRVRVAYDAMLSAKGQYADDAVAFFDERYASKENDEFIKPTVITENGHPVAIIKENDSVIFFNYRADRAMEITATLVNKIKTDAKGAFAGVVTPSIYFVSMTEYKEGLNEHIAYGPIIPPKTLGEVVSNEGLLQLRIAETEKYAHVTFFFNGGADKKFPGEDRILVPSPQEVNGLYDKKPEMSANEVTDKLIGALDEQKYDLIVLNFANMDMVGHTGQIDKAIQAVETVDACVGKLWEKIKAYNGVMVLTADHGNADVMVDEKGGIMTAHSMSPVPLVVAGYNKTIKLREGGRLADIAPTVLEIMGIDQPAEMTSTSLILK
jgi:2,3-bisphosphoglycerate-independent phosphoglycerate mutase